MRFRLLVFFVAFLASHVVIAGQHDEKKARVCQAREKAEARIARRERALGLTDAKQQLREISATPTAAAVILRYQQLHQGIPVRGGELIVRIAANRETETNGLVLPLAVDPVPRIDDHEAIDTAVRHLKLKRKLEEPKAELMIVPSQSLGEGIPAGDRLAWVVSAFTANDADGLVSRTVFVDAHSGQVLTGASI